MFGLAASVDDMPTTAVTKEGSGQFIHRREHIAKNAEAMILQITGAETKSNLGISIPIKPSRPTFEHHAANKLWTQNHVNDQEISQSVLCI